MAHKTLIDGAAYSISGGKTLVDGTAYNIAGGRTLVDGTGYDVGFAPDMATVIINNESQSSPNPSVIFSKVSVVINGETYSGGTISVPIGTVISCKIVKGGTGCTATIIENASTVASSTLTTTDPFIYEYTVLSDTAITLNGYYNTAEITINNIPTLFTIDGVECKMFGDMTWNSWLNTSLNTTDMTRKSFGIKNADGSLAMFTDVIVSGENYIRPPMTNVSITGTGSDGTRVGSYVDILGVSYHSPDELSVPIGAVLKFTAKYSYNQSGATYDAGSIKLNGEQIAAAGSTHTYEYTLTRSIDVYLGFGIASNYGSISGIGWIEITEK